VVGANLAFEPLVGELFRAGYVMASAAAHGDYTTPSIIGVAESDFDRDLEYTKDLIGPLVTDAQHGRHNIQVLGQWLERWVPMSLAAAQALEPIWTMAADTPVTFADALGRARMRTRLLFDELTLPTPKELLA
jgi:propane 2-monooxygenase small subunit